VGVGVWGLGFRVRRLGFEVSGIYGSVGQGLGIRVQDLDFWGSGGYGSVVSVFGFRSSGSVFRLLNPEFGFGFGFGFQVTKPGVRVWFSGYLRLRERGLGSGVWGSRFGVSGFGLDGVTGGWLLDPGFGIRVSGLEFRGVAGGWLLDSGFGLGGVTGGWLLDSGSGIRVLRLGGSRERC